MSHLTESDRLKIEHGLRNKMSFQKIAEGLGKSRSTIFRDIMKHRQTSSKGAPGRIANRCIHRRDCNVYYLCKSSKCSRKCSTCKKCNDICTDFKEEVCHKLSKPPRVCNGCPDEHRCVLKKQFYIYTAAQEEYNDLLIEARRGINLTEDEKSQISQTIHAGTLKGQSVHHIMNANKDLFTVCEKSVYRYINSGIIRTKRGDMPRSCIMKPRKKKNIEHKVDTKCRINRKHEDFKNYCQEHPDFPIVEMDSVLGRRGGKVLLTIHFNNCGLLLAFLRDANNSQSVIDVFRSLEERLTLEVFKKLFQVVLTDNGSEFSNPTALETSTFAGEQRTKIFYCNPYSSWQKSHVENNHLNLRKIITKGRNIDKFTQEEVNIVLSHVNSMARKSLNDVPAITLFETIYGKGILEKLGIFLINKKEVHLLPDLINK